jgi:hypothetical protein
MEQPSLRINEVSQAARTLGHLVEYPWRVA